MRLVSDREQWMRLVKIPHVPSQPVEVLGRVINMKDKEEVQAALLFLHYILKKM